MAQVSERVLHDGGQHDGDMPGRDEPERRGVVQVQRCPRPLVSQPAVLHDRGQPVSQRPLHPDGNVRQSHGNHVHVSEAYWNNYYSPMKNHRVIL